MAEGSVTAGVFDVDESDFPARVVERSRELPVVVDFWAEWCGPCRALTPALEAAVAARPGKIELAKVDVDANQRLAVEFRVQGIPAVKAFRDGAVAAEFTGALPPQQVEAFFDGLVPSEADELAARGAAEGDEAALREALELDAANAQARQGLARLLLRRGEAAEARDLTADADGDYLSIGLGARAELSLTGAHDLAAAFEAWDAGHHAAALEGLQSAFGAADGDRRDLIRRVMVGIFTELGPGDPLAGDHRRRLSAAMN